MVHPVQGQLVQDVAAADGAAPPSRYVLREKDRPVPPSRNNGDGSGGDDLVVIPTVDVSRLADPGDVEEAEKLRSALQSWGLFVATGHGMPGTFLDEVLGVTREFFHLPAETKREYSNVTEAAVGDGGKKQEYSYEGYGVDRVDSDEQILDWSDRLYLQVLPEDQRKLHFWPNHPPSLRELLHEYAMKSEEVAKRVLKGMAGSLGFKEEFFVDKVGERMPSFARLAYYPPCPRPDLVYGLKPHTDNSVVTVLLLDKDVGGLQVLREDGDGEGRWIDVPVLGHGLLVVVGDQMEIMSNAAFRAPVHRVVTSADRERVTLVLFYQPEPHRILEPSRELVVDGERPALFRTLETKTFADGFWDAFALGERTMDYLKVKIVDGVEPEAAVSGAA